MKKAAPKRDADLLMAAAPPLPVSYSPIGEAAREWAGTGKGLLIFCAHCGGRLLRKGKKEHNDE